jgi:hypothetical protein
MVEREPQYMGSRREASSELRAKLMGNGVLAVTWRVVSLLTENA